MGLKKNLGRAVSSAAAGLACAIGGAALAQPFNPGQTAFTTWMGALSQNGYTVTSGSYTTFPGCSVFIGAFGSCFGNNTATPYLLTQPPVTNPNNLPSYAGSGSGFTGQNGTQLTDDLWQIGPDEAIVTVITLPPQGAYFGFQSYVLERDPATYGATTPTNCIGGEPDGIYTETPDCNFEVFGTITNTVNNGDVAQIAAFNGSSWNTYNDNNSPPTPNTYNTIAIVSSPNKTLVGKMEAYFAGAAGTVFTEPMPAVSTGTGSVARQVIYPCLNPVASQCDAFASLIRFTLAKNQLESGAWQTGNNVLVYRVELPGVGIGSSDLYDTQTNASSIFPQGCNTNETSASGAPSSCVPASTASIGFDYDLKQIAAVLRAWGVATISENYSINEASGSTATSTNGGVGGCVALGNNCAGGTQDTDFYRTYRAGTLKNMAPVFVVGVLHSDSPNDFSGGATAPLNNADYTGISIADDSNTYMNTGIADAANPNSASEYYLPPPQRILLGSAYAVLNYLTDGSPATSLFSQLPLAVQKDVNNIYIHVFQRNDSYGTGAPCPMQTCNNAIANDVTTIINGSQPVAQPLGQTPPGPGTIPDADPVLFTERAYLLAPTPGSSPELENFTGAAVQFLQSPYIVCDTVGTHCGNAP